MSSDKDDLIRKELLKLITSTSDCLKVAKVLSVDKAKQTCKVKLVSDDVEVTARLRSVEDSENKGSWYAPKVGSTVVVGRMAQFKRHVVLMFSEIDEMHITCDKVVYNGGTLGGLIKIDALVSYLQTIDTWTQKLKQVIDVSSYPTAAPGSPDTFHAALKAAIDPIGSTNVSKGALENTKIKH